MLLGLVFAVQILMAHGLSVENSSQLRFIFTDEAFSGYLAFEFKERSTVTAAELCLQTHPLLQVRLK